MKRDSSKLFIMAGSLLGVVLLTAAVIYSYGGQNAASRRSARLPAPSPQTSPRRSASNGRDAFSGCA